MPTQVQVNQINAWCASKGVNLTCPACNKFGAGWEAGEVIAAPALIGGNFTIGGPTVPMVPVVCRNCAYARLFAAVPMGLAN